MLHKLQLVVIEVVNKIRIRTEIKRGGVLWELKG